MSKELFTSYLPHPSHSPDTFRYCQYISEDDRRFGISVFGLKQIIFFARGRCSQLTTTSKNKVIGADTNYGEMMSWEVVCVPQTIGLAFIEAWRNGDFKNEVIIGVR